MTIKIALDVLGGDHSIDAVLGGLQSFLLQKQSSQDAKTPAVDVFFNLFGPEDKIVPELSKFPQIPEKIFKIYYTEGVIDACMKPSHALRCGRGSSMFEAINSVFTGASDAVVSAGNTGAYMALSKAILKTIEGIDRPALVSLLPTASGANNVLLDLGANAECDSLNLLQFALMGSAVAKALLQIDHPKIGLLNVGTEKSKGTDCVREAHELISERFGDDFVGFVEGRDIQQDVANVVVTDGFSGNIALKTIEGTFRFIANLYKQNVSSSMLGKISYLVSKPVLDKMWEVVDPRKHNGASLVGLNGIAVKSHGNADALSFASAISVAVRLAKSNFVQNIKALMDK